MDRTGRERLKWRCRRGLLELDIVLSRFMDRETERLTDDDAQALRELLDCSDNDLWDILSGRSERFDARLRPLVERLRTA